MITIEYEYPLGYTFESDLKEGAVSVQSMAKRHVPYLSHSLDCTEKEVEDAIFKYHTERVNGTNKA